MHFSRSRGSRARARDKAHKDEIEVFSFSWGAAQTGSRLERRWRGSREGLLPGHPLHDADQQGGAEPDARLRNREALPEATLTCRKAGGSQVEFLKIKLADVLVSSYQNGGSNLSDLKADALPADQLSLNFAKIDFLYTVDRTGETVETVFDQR